MKKYLILECPIWIRLLEIKAKVHLKFNPEKELCDMGYKEITPIFNRNGHYYDRKDQLVWIEYDGKAWMKENQESEIIQFKLDLEFLELEEDQPNKEVLKTMSGLIGKSKKSSRYHKNYKQMQKDIREYSFSHWARIHALRSKKRFIEFKKRRKNGESNNGRTNS